MRRSTLRLYGPFLALALVQALFIVAAPSKAPDRTALSAGGPAGRTGAGASGFTPSGTGTGTPGDVSGGAAGGGAGGSASGGGGGGNATSNVGGGNLAVGDTSHCTGPYQFDVLLSHGPPCQPVFGGDNGGATADGVTDKEIHIILFQAHPNEQVTSSSAPRASRRPWPRRTRPSRRTPHSSTRATSSTDGRLSSRRSSATARRRRPTTRSARSRLRRS